MCEIEEDSEPVPLFCHRVIVWTKNRNWRGPGLLDDNASVPVHEGGVAERFFYHSFPRPRQGLSEEDNCEKGLRILRSMADIGLLLTPETLEFREFLEDGTLGPKVVAAQRRACFTELAPSELRRHSLEFGPFALELDVMSLRELGAMPVWPSGSRSLSCPPGTAARSFASSRDRSAAESVSSKLSWARRSIKKFSPRRHPVFLSSESCRPLHASFQVPNAPSTSAFLTRGLVRPARQFLAMPERFATRLGLGRFPAAISFQGRGHGFESPGLRDPLRDPRRGNNRSLFPHLSAGEW